MYMLIQMVKLTFLIPIPQDLVGGLAILKGVFPELNKESSFSHFYIYSVPIPS